MLFKASLLNNLYFINLENKIIIENILLTNTIKNSKQENSKYSNKII